MKKIYLLCFFITALSYSQVFTITPPTWLRHCDDDLDSSYAFDLTLKNAEILGTINQTLYSVQYFESEIDS